jgi:hypothetical protein
VVKQETNEYAEPDECEEKACFCFVRELSFEPEIERLPVYVQFTDQASNFIAHFQLFSINKKNSLII